MTEPISSESLAKTCKEYFSFVWQLYQEMQIPMLLGVIIVYCDVDSFHGGGICLINHALNSFSLY